MKDERGVKVGARKQMLEHARELSCLCLLVTFADARAAPNPKLWKRFSQYWSVQTKPNVSDLLMMHTN